MNGDTPKNQWTGQWTTLRNGVSISENFTVRNDDYEELLKKRHHILDNFAPTVVKFPDDTGNVAHTETQETAPLCPVHKTPMSWKPPGISKTTKNPYPGFWSCGTKNADGSWCRAKPEGK